MGCRIKLNKLHILERNPNTQGQRLTVPRNTRRIIGILIHMPEAACGNNNSPGFYSEKCPIPADAGGAADSAFRNQQG